MATSKIVKMSDYKSDAENGVGIAADANRMLGTRTVLPGEYEFDANPNVKISEFQTTSTNGQPSRTFYSTEVQAKNGKWVNIDSLCKKTMRDGAYTFVNEFVGEAQDTVSLAASLCGHKLIVSKDQVDVYTTWYSKNGEPAESHPGEPKRSGLKAFVAKIA